MTLAVIPAFAIKVTTDGKHNLEKAAGKYQGLEIFKKMKSGIYVARMTADGTNL